MAYLRSGPRRPTPEPPSASAYPDCRTRSASSPPRPRLLTRTPPPPPTPSPRRLGPASARSSPPAAARRTRPEPARRAGHLVRRPRPPPGAPSTAAAWSATVMAMKASSRVLWASRAAVYLRIFTFPRAFSTVLKDLKYADTHEWVKVDGGSATIGITDHAQDHLGDAVYVELPEVGNSVYQGKNFGAVESVKATSDINSPVSGEVIEVNGKLSGEPGLLNASPYDKGWIIKVKLSDSGELSSLMDDEQYSKFCEEEDKDKH